MQYLESDWRHAKDWTNPIGLHCTSENTVEYVKISRVGKDFCSGSIWDQAGDMPRIGLILLVYTALENTVDSK